MKDLNSLPSSRCRSCPLFPQLRNFVPGTRRPGAKIAWVGEAPGEWETKRGEGFVGRSGELLTRLAKKAGISRSDVTLSNVLKCRPPDNKLPEEPELSLAVECCSEILTEDVKDVRVIVAIGNLSLRAFTGLRGILVRRGSVYETGDGKFVVALIHPAALSRAQHMKEKEKIAVPPYQVFVTDLRRARRIAEDPDFRLPAPTILTHPTREELEAFLVRMQDPETKVGVDIETVGGQSIVPTIISFAVYDLAVVVSFEDELEWIVEALESPARKILHNGAIFDLEVLQHPGFRINNYWLDTLYAHHTVYAELRHNLGFVQSIHTFLPYHKDMASDSVDIEEVFEK